MKYFLEKIQDIRLYHNDKENTPFGAAYNFPTFPSELDILVKVFLFNIKPNKDYVIVVKYISSHEQTTLHLLNNVTLNVSEKDMIHLDQGYGLSFGVFSTKLPIEHTGEIELELELRGVDEIDTILDSYKTYIAVGDGK